MRTLQNLPLWPAIGLLATLVATTPPAEASDVIDTTVNVAGTEYPARWWLPAGTPVGLALVEHGFTRRCQNIDGTARALRDQGLLALCLTVPLSGGNPVLADALAALVVNGLTAPDGQPLPQAWMVGGHSAGGDFAVRLGSTLAQLAPSRIRGAVLWDPVPSGSGFIDGLRALSAGGARPVLAVTANPGPCNANGNVLPPLRTLQQELTAAGADAFVGLQLIDRSTHTDVEAENTNRYAWAACRQGPPRRWNVDALRELSATWARDIVTGARSAAAYPGGATVEALIGAQRATLID
jgi:hypothetical protein